MNDMIAALLAINWERILPIVVSIAALSFTGYNVLALRRQNEINLILGSWERYEKYSLDLTSAIMLRKKAVNPALETKIEIHVVNLINFIENLCMMYNTRVGTRRFRDNVGEIATAFLSHMYSSADNKAIMEKYIFSSRTYEEIKRFRDLSEQRKAKIARRRGEPPPE